MVSEATPPTPNDDDFRTALAALGIWSRQALNDVRWPIKSLTGDKRDLALVEIAKQIASSAGWLAAASPNGRL